MGDLNDWILDTYSDTTTKNIDHAFSVAGHVIFLVNERTHAASPITWSSKKIERVVSSLLAAETLGLVKLIGVLYFIKEILKQIYGREQGNI